MEVSKMVELKITLRDKMGVAYTGTIEVDMKKILDEYNKAAMDAIDEFLDFDLDEEE